MLPESEAPPLAHYEEFKALAEEFDVKVSRHYVWPEPPRRASAEYGDEDPKWSGDYWEVIIRLERIVPDDRNHGRIYMQMLRVPDRLIEQAWAGAWQVQFELLEAGLKRTLEEHGVA
jgi:hypothetical protein